MRYIVRRNFRHNGKLYLTGDKPDIAVLDETMRVNVRAGVLEPLASKQEQKKHEGKKHEGKKHDEPKKTDEGKPEEGKSDGKPEGDTTEGKNPASWTK